MEHSCFLPKQRASSGAISATVDIGVDTVYDVEICGQGSTRKRTCTMAKCDVSLYVCACSRCDSKIRSLLSKPSCFFFFFKDF